jgi:hypothetical protein
MPPIDDIAPWTGLEQSAAMPSERSCSPRSSSARSPSPATEAEALLHKTRIYADNTEADHTMMGVRSAQTQTKIDTTMGKNGLLDALQGLYALKEKVTLTF